MEDLSQDQISGEQDAAAQKQGEEVGLPRVATIEEGSGEPRPAQPPHADMVGEEVLLHADRDFAPMTEHLGLRTA